VELFPKGKHLLPLAIFVAPEKLLVLVMLINCAVRFRHTFTSQLRPLFELSTDLSTGPEAFSITWTKELNLGP
jgi:hypothetical protein